MIIFSKVCIAETIEVPLEQKVTQTENIFFIICFHNTWPNYKKMMPKSLNSVFVVVERFFLVFSSK